MKKLLTNMRKFQDTIPIKIEILQESDGFVAYVVDDNFPEFRPCIVQGDSEEDAKKELMITIKIIQKFNKAERVRYMQRAIFRGNYSKNQLWFSILGIGITFYWRTKKVAKLLRSRKPSYQFHIGRLYWSFHNYWRLKP